MLEHHEDQIYFFKKKSLLIYLAALGPSCVMWDLRSFLCDAGSLLVACKHLIAACGFCVPDQGLNLHPLYWEHRALAIGQAGKSQKATYIFLFIITISQPS